MGNTLTMEDLNFGHDDAILVITKDMELNLIIPDMPTDDVPDNVALVSAVATKINIDDVFVSNLMEWFSKHTKTMGSLEDAEIDPDTTWN